MKQSESLVRVRYKDTDQMGVVYYANYFVWFEIGRTDFLRELGMSYKDLEQNGLYLPVIEAYCKYKNPARYDDQLKVITRLQFLQEVRLGFQYEIIHTGTGELLVQGETAHAFVSKAGKPVVLRKQNPFLWRILKDQVQDKEI